MATAWKAGYFAFVLLFLQILMNYFKCQFLVFLIFEKLMRKILSLPRFFTEYAASSHPRNSWMSLEKKKMVSAQDVFCSFSEMGPNKWEPSWDDDCLRHWCMSFLLPPPYGILEINDNMHAILHCGLHRWTTWVSLKCSGKRRNFRRVILRK